MFFTIGNKEVHISRKCYECKVCDTVLCCDNDGKGNVTVCIKGKGTIIVSRSNKSRKVNRRVQKTGHRDASTDDDGVLVHLKNARQQRNRKGRRRVFRDNECKRK